MIKQTKNISKIAVISGSTGYVGSAVARKLAVDGMRIAMLYHRTSRKTVEDILTKLSGSGHKTYSCNIEDDSQVAETLKAIENDLGDIYACVHAAGEKPKRKQLLLSSIEDLRDQFKMNVFGSFNFLSACAKRLKEHKRGVMVGITTAGVVVPSASRSLGAYIPAKYALQGMLASFKEELKPYGVRVYSVAPGFMHGGMNSDIPKAFADMIKEKSPTKRLASADDVANKISFLCSDEAVKVTDLTFLLAPEITGE